MDNLLHMSRGFPPASSSKESACSAGDLGLGRGREDPLEKGMQPTPLFWPEKLWTEEPGRLQSMGSRQESGMAEPLTLLTHVERSGIQRGGHDGPSGECGCGREAV